MGLTEEFIASKNRPSLPDTVFAALVYGDVAFLAFNTEFQKIQTLAHGF